MPEASDYIAARAKGLDAIRALRQGAPPSAPPADAEHPDRLALVRVGGRHAISLTWVEADDVGASIEIAIAHAAPSGLIPRASLRLHGTAPRELARALDEAAPLLDAARDRWLAFRPLNAERGQVADEGGR